MYRTNTCGELRLADAGKTVTLAGWVQKARKLGGMTFIDLRDRYGITQLVTEEDPGVGREWVIQVTGQVVERQSKNPKMPTGDIEVKIEKVNILNKANIDIVGTAFVDEGITLRAGLNYSGEIVVLNQPAIEEIDNIIEHNITVGACYIDFVKKLSETASKKNELSN